jgi:hypothetical protein
VLGAAAPQALGAYRALARLTATRALAAGLLSTEDARRLSDVLAGQGEPDGQSQPDGQSESGGRDGSDGRGEAPA